MKRCLKIQVSGKVQGVGYRAFAQKHAQSLSIEGTIQNAEDGSVVIYASGQGPNLDKFIDALYQGTSACKVKELIAEPLLHEKDFRGVFRIIGD